MAAPSRRGWPVALLVAFAAAAAAAGGATCTSTGASSGGGAPSDALDGATLEVDAAACGACLAVKCADALKACKTDCLALQACIDAVCGNLSAESSPDEGACQVMCQSLHPNGVAAQLDLVNCAASESVIVDAGLSCIPPCVGAPLDFNACATHALATSCATYEAACTQDPDCSAYRACADGCGSLEACEACAAGPDASAGLATLEAVDACVARACIALEWLPHF